MEIDKEVFMLAQEMKTMRAGDQVTAPFGDSPRRRRGEVVQVERNRCRVRWDEGDETFVYPGLDIRVERRNREEIA